jgi:hypothetical protein
MHINTYILYLINVASLRGNPYDSMAPNVCLIFSKEFNCTGVNSFSGILINVYRYVDVNVHMDMQIHN